mgnify:CR=1 FL=1
MTQLVQGLAQDRIDYIQLQQQLEFQRTFLLTRDTEQLSALSQQLLYTYQVLSERAVQRQRQLRELNVSADKEGMYSLFQRLSIVQRQKVSALLSDLECQVQRTHALNERNGMVLHMQQDIMDNIINADRPDAFLY